jgi:FKBP-type peptidyl-prolyl cis-trans isomerase FkpA
MSKYAIVALLFASACTGKSGLNTSSKPTQEMDKASYAIGFEIGKNLTTQGYDSLSSAWLAEGLADGLVGNARLSDEERETVLMAIEEMANASREAKQQEANADLYEKESAFLAENAKKAGIVVTESGLQYEVITMGKGKKPQPTDNVKVHYSGTLTNGTKFDSSYDRGEPASFPLNRVIPGWTEGVSLMPVGSKFRFFVPSKLGYGERGAGQVIGPVSTLIFEVELLEILK